MDIKTKGLKPVNKEVKKSEESLKNIETFIVLVSLSATIVISFFIQDTKLMFFLTQVFGG
ncbi:MAG: hypothetical protein VXY34_10280 [Bdellovibrionota bacterium]|jgi:hypothetical protein|nr:hypothetical protein [Bdellovibrionota bacterium]